MLGRPKRVGGRLGYVRADRQDTGVRHFFATVRLKAGRRVMRVRIATVRLKAGRHVLRVRIATVRLKPDTTYCEPARRRSG